MPVNLFNIEVYDLIKLKGSVFIKKPKSYECIFYILHVMSKPKHIAAALQGSALSYAEIYHTELPRYCRSLRHGNDRHFSEWHFPQILVGK